LLAFDAHVRGGESPSEYCRDVLYGKKREWHGYPTVKKLSRRFDRIHERDRQTDGQTPYDGIGRAYA